MPKCKLCDEQLGSMDRAVDHLKDEHDAFTLLVDGFIERDA